MFPKSYENLFSEITRLWQFDTRSESLVQKEGFENVLKLHKAANALVIFIILLNLKALRVLLQMQLLNT